MKKTSPSSGPGPEADPQSDINSHAVELIETTGTLFCVASPEGYFLELNPVWTDTLGWSLDELKARPYFEFIHPDDMAVTKETAQAVDTGHHVMGFRNRYRCKDGQYRWLKWRARIHPGNGHIYAAVEDVTDEVSSYQLVSMAQELARMGSWRLDLCTKAVFWSEMTYRIHEVKLGTPIKLEEGINYYVPEHRPLIEEAVERASQTGEPWDLQLQILTTTGRRVWVRALGRPVFVDEQLRYLEGVFQDIDDSKRKELRLAVTEKKVQELNERVNLALEASLMGVWEWRIDTNELIWDSQMHRLYGTDEKTTEVSYSLWERTLEPSCLRRLNEELKEALEGKGKLNTKFQAILPNGESRHIRSVAEVIRKNGKPHRMLGVNWDATEDAKKEALLKSALLEAQAAAVTKSRFLANMSHEVRTPLNGILGICRLLRERADADTADQLDLVLRSSDTLLSVINDVLDFSRLESGMAPVEQSATDVHTLTADVVSLFEASAEQKGIAVICDIRSSVPRYLLLDHIKTKQVLSNLVGNAVKFTSDGLITLAVSYTSHSEEHEGTLHFHVIDQGVGIAEDQIERLFEPFTQADSSTTRTMGGTGLGLAICRQISDLLGGTLTVESQPKVGSTFEFSFPVEVAAPPEKPRRETPIKPVIDEFVKLRVLVAEDNPINLSVLQGNLERIGIQGENIEVATNGQEAFDLAKRHSFDVVFMDCQMPVLDGFRATELIRESTEISEQPYVIAATASVLKEDIDRCYQCGMNNVLTKPLRRDEIIEALSESQKPPAAEAS